jgi:hypothetical protein
MHPCHENLPDYVSRGLVQPWDTSLLPSFKQLNPYLVSKGQMNGKQYMIPWDWGYGSLSYRTDNGRGRRPLGTASNPKCRADRWGSLDRVRGRRAEAGVPAHRPADLQPVNRRKRRCSRTLNKFYWESEYSRCSLRSSRARSGSRIPGGHSGGDEKKRSGRIHEPSQGYCRLCGFMLGAHTRTSPRTRLRESFINHNACAQMTNLYYYGTANTP